MQTPTARTIAQIERHLSSRRRSIGSFCRQVGVARSTWTRWRLGQTSPRAAVWRRVERELSALGVAG